MTAMLPHTNRPRRQHLATWALVSTLSLVSPLIATQAHAATPAVAWAPTEVRPATEAAERLAAAGWTCSQSVAWPGATTRQVSLCRRRNPPADAQLQLIAHDVAGESVRELARLADASRASLRLFAPPQPCAAAGGACLDGVLLVDQRDEGSCYGTQVFVRVDGGEPRSVGFLNELRVRDGEEQCIGSLAQVSGAGGVAFVELTAPLWRGGGARGPVALKDPLVRYRITARSPTLDRLSPAPR